MPKQREDIELTNRIEHLLSGQTTLVEAQNNTSRKNRELLNLASRLRYCQPESKTSFQKHLEKKLLRQYKYRRLSTFAFGSRFRRIRIVATASLATLLLLSGIAMAIPGMRKLIVNPPSGNIEVLSTPGGAKVFLNNTFKGNTPLRLTDITAGSYELKISKENYEDWSGLLKVKPKTTQRVFVELNKIEVLMVKPKDIAKANKAASTKTETTSLSPDSGESSQPPQEISKQDNNANSHPGNLSSSSVSSSNPSESSSLKPDQPTVSSGFLFAFSNNSLYLISTRGEKEIVLDGVSTFTNAAISPSGTKLALASKGTLQILNFNDKEPKLIYKINHNSIENFCWSPNEEFLLFTALEEGSLKPNIYITKISSQEVRKVASGTISSWSPEGREIAYTKENGGIFITDSKGSEERQIISQVKISDLKWSPWGTRIAFIGTLGDEESTSPGLFLINRDGTEIEKIGSTCSGFSWSPDGKSIVFEKTEKQESNIYVVNLEDSKLDQLSLAKSARDPIFSPDSKRIAFTKEDGLYIVNTDGSNPMQISSEPNLTLIGWVCKPFSSMQKGFSTFSEMP